MLASLITLGEDGKTLVNRLNFSDGYRSKSPFNWSPVLEQVRKHVKANASLQSGHRRVVGEGNQLKLRTIEAGSPRTLRWKCGFSMIGRQGEE